MGMKHKIGNGDAPFLLQPFITLVGLYNGMIYPLRHYTFKGVVWYQESQMYVGANIRLAQCIDSRLENTFSKMKIFLLYH